MHGSCPQFFALARCPRPGPRRHMIAKNGSGREIGIRTRCRRWTCPTCAAWLAQRWCERFHEALERDGAKVLHTCHLSAQKAWPKVQHSIQRAGAKYIKVAVGSTREEYIVWCTVSLPGSRPLAADDTVENFADAIGTVHPDADGSPISSSRGWLPSVAKNERLWQLLGFIPADEGAFEAALLAELAAGQLSEAQISRSRMLAGWSFPAEATEAQRVATRNRFFYPRRMDKDTE
jgi:hypothetical protein